MKKQLIKKSQLGGPIARLALQRKSPGSWGNRGPGNELHSAVENAVAWTGDKIFNAGEYLSRGLDWIIGAVDPTMTAQESVEEGIARRIYESTPLYEMRMINGKETPVLVYLPPQTGIPPLPTLPGGAHAKLVEARKKLVPLWKNARLREYQFLAGTGSKKGIPLELTKSWLKYTEGLKNYNDELVNMNVVPDEVAVITDETKKLKDSKDFKHLVYKQDKETKPIRGKKKASYRSSEYMFDGDSRHVADVGRIAHKQYDYVDDLINKYSPDLRKRMARYKEHLAAAKDPKLLELILQSMNLARLSYLRQLPSYLKNVLKLYQHLEAKLGHILDKQINNMK